MLAWGGVLLALLGADPAAVRDTAASGFAGWAASLRLENRTRTDQPGEPGGAFPLETEVDAELGLAGADGPWSGAAAYLPRLTLEQIDGRQGSTVLHQGLISGELHLNSVDRVIASQQLAVGQIDFSPLAAAVAGGAGSAAPPLDPQLARHRVEQYVLSNSLLGLTAAVSPRVLLTATAAYDLDGGLGAAARQAVPLLQGPRATAAATLAATPLDAVRAQSEVQLAWSSAGTNTAIADLSGMLTHTFAPGTLAGLELGFAVAHGSAQAATALPIAGLTVETNLPVRGQKLSTQLSLRTSAVPDRYSGAAYEQAEGALSLDWSPLEALDFTARASAGRILTGEARGASVDELETLGSFVALRGISFGIGARGAFVGGGGSDQVSGVLWSAFVFARALTLGSF